tara:strand:- start:261 stop:767 length:507 start_codon:yes stop_codon:yes gene_type:complete
MSAGILNFNQYIGGPDDIKIEQVFPNTTKTFLYDFNQDITNWTFSADYQTIVVDTITFNRNTGQPNFANSKVVGTFAKGELTGADEPDVVNATVGTVKVYMPADMYTGPILPDARQNVPIVVMAVTWTDDATPATITTHRWAFVQCWEPDITAGDPTLDAGYTAIVLG